MLFSRPDRTSGAARLRRAALAAAGLGLLLGACSGSDAASEITAAGETVGVITQPDRGLGNQDVRGVPLPIVEVGDAAGNAVSSASFLGQPLVVNFWFSTCPPCARELSDFAEVEAEVRDEVRFVGINPIDSVQVMERFAGERGVEYDLFLDDTNEFTDAIEAAAFPITLFVTADGDIVDQTGPLDADELRTNIEQLLETTT